MEQAHRDGNVRKMDKPHDDDDDYLMSSGDSNFQTLEKKMVISLETHKILFCRL